MQHIVQYLQSVVQSNCVWSTGWSENRGHYVWLRRKTMLKFIYCNIVLSGSGVLKTWTVENGGLDFFWLTLCTFTTSHKETYVQNHKVKYKLQGPTPPKAQQSHNQCTSSSIRKQHNLQNTALSGGTETRSTAGLRLSWAWCCSCGVA